MRTWRSGPALFFLAVATTATAGPLSFIGPSGDWHGLPMNEVFGIGTAAEDGRLLFEIRTNIPQDGFYGNDGQGYTLFLPGDVYIAVGSSDPFDPNAAVHGVATTSHANVLTDAYPGETWQDVVQGRLYTNADFAAGRYDKYAEWLEHHGLPAGDGYPTLIKHGTEVLGVSGLSYDDAEPGADWDYTITGWVELTAIALEPETDYAVFFAIECGNEMPGGPGDWAGGGPPPGVIPERRDAAWLLFGLLAVWRTAHGPPKR